MDDITSLVKAIPLAFAALLPVVNPLGTAIILLGLTDKADDATRRKIAREVAVNSVVLLAAILVAGRGVLALFGISVPIVQLAGGIVLAAMGWTMLLAPDDSASTTTVASPAAQSGDYSSSIFYPFTFPLTIGPGGVAVTITLSAHTSRDHFLATAMSQVGAFIGIVLVAFVTYLCLANAGRLANRLGQSGLSVLTRLSAFVIVCLGAQISWSGVRTLVASMGAAS